MDLSARNPAGRFTIEAYGDGRFRIAGSMHIGSILIAPDRILPWGAVSVGGLSPEQFLDQLSPLINAAERSPEILLLGCGPRMELIGPVVRGLFKQRGAVLEPMDTGAACRTYNVLVAEDRLVAAALIVV